jgi:tetratricopeptide (TPR) repeat protein
MQTKRYPLAALAFVDAREAFRTRASHALEDQVGYERQVDEQIRALESLRRSLEPQDRNGPGRPKLVDPNATLQRVDAQISQLRAQRKRTPDRPEDTPAWISLALGSAYFRSDRMSDAEREYREALRAEPKLGEGHNNLAVVLMLTGRYEEADEEIKAAEKAGFRVNPQLKEDLKAGRKGA